MEDMQPRGPVLPPYNIEAEKSLLGGMLISREAQGSAMELINEDDFYKVEHQVIFAAMRELYDRGSAIDAVTVIEALVRAGKLDFIGGVPYITELSMFVPSAANTEYYAGIVEENSVRRKLMRAGSEMMKDAAESDCTLEELLNTSELRVFNISMRKNENTLVHIADRALSVYMHIGELVASRGKLTGITTGFSELDKMTSGFQRGDLIIIAGRPSMGKTAFALNVAEAAATRGNATVCVFSLEMSAEQLITRVMCSHAGVDMQRVRTGYTDENEMVRLADSLDAVTGAKIYINDTGAIGVAEIRSKCRRLKAKVGLDMVVIDYLGLMKLNNPRGQASLTQQISEVTRQLKILARELDVPIVLLSQLSRDVTRRQDHRPMMSDLRDSGSIEQDADVIIMLHRPAVYAPDDDEEAKLDNTAEAIVSKQRNGPIGTVYLSWISQYARFTDRSEREEM